MRRDMSRPLLTTASSSCFGEGIKSSLSGNSMWLEYLHAQKQPHWRHGSQVHAGRDSVNRH